MLWSFTKVLLPVVKLLWSVDKVVSLFLMCYGMRLTCYDRLLMRYGRCLGVKAIAKMLW